MPTSNLAENVVGNIASGETAALQEIDLLEASYADASVTPAHEIAKSSDEANSLAAVEAGLDSLQTSQKRSRGWHGRTLLRKAGPPLLAIALVLLAWQAVVWSGIQPIWNFPGPQQVAESLQRSASNGELWIAMRTSLERGVLGFIIAVAIGTPLGIVIARVKVVRAAIGPIITALSVLPSVAWVPAAIIWFGLSNATVFFVVLMGAVPSIVNGLVAGVDQVPPLYRRVGHVLGARPFDMVTKIVLPAALPGYLAGLKQGWAFSWRSLMAAEIIAVGGSIGFGLGGLLQRGRDLADMSGVISAILLILVIGIAIEMLFFAPVERGILRRRGLYAETA